MHQQINEESKMKKNRLSVLLCAGLFFTSTSVYAETYELEAAHTSIGFSVRHLGINNVKGTFGTFSGTIEYDPAKPENTKVDVTIDSGSINTENKKRDDHVRSKDFLDVSLFPKITFKSKSVTVDSPTSMTVVGDLTILNYTKPVELKVTDIIGPVKNPLDKKNHIGASVTGQIKRQDFGVTWNGGGMTGAAGEAAIGDVIKFDFEVDGVQK